MRTMWRSSSRPTKVSKAGLTVRCFRFGCRASLADVSPDVVRPGTISRLNETSTDARFTFAPELPNGDWATGGKNVGEELLCVGSRHRLARMASGSLLLIRGAPCRSTRGRFRPHCVQLGKRERCQRKLCPGMSTCPSFPCRCTGPNLMLLQTLSPAEPGRQFGGFRQGNGELDLQGDHGEGHRAA